MIVGVPDHLVTILQARTDHMRGKGREGKGREGKGRRGKGREGKEREGGKGRDGKGGREGKGREVRTGEVRTGEENEKPTPSGEHDRHLLKWQRGPNAQRDQVCCGLQCYTNCMHAGMRPQ